MTGIDFDSALVWFKCETCNGTGVYGFTSAATFVDPDYCYDCSGNREIGVYIGTWLTNLAIAAALCRADSLGWNRCADNSDMYWRPGCRKDAP